MGSSFIALYTKSSTHEEFVIQAAGIGLPSRSPVARQALSLTSVVSRTSASKRLFGLRESNEGGSVLTGPLPSSSNMLFSRVLSFDVLSIPIKFTSVYVLNLDCQSKSRVCSI